MENNSIVRVNEVCLLVLGFLREEKFKDSFDTFSKECHKEVKGIQKSQSKSVKSLISILNEYLILKEEKRKRDTYINSIGLNSKISLSDPLYNKIHESLNSIYTIVEDYTYFKRLENQQNGLTDLSTQTDMSNLFSSTTLKRKKPSESSNKNATSTTDTSNTDTPAPNSFLYNSNATSVSSGSKKSKVDIVESIKTANSKSQSSKSTTTTTTTTTLVDTTTPKKSESRRKNMTPKKFQSSPNNVNNNFNFSNITPIISFNSLNSTIESNSYNNLAGEPTNNNNNNNINNNFVPTNFNEMPNYTDMLQMSNMPLIQKLTDLINSQYALPNGTDTQLPEYIPNNNELILVNNNNNNNNPTNPTSLEPIDYSTNNNNTSLINNILTSIEADPGFGNLLYNSIDNNNNNNLNNSIDNNAYLNFNVSASQINESSMSPITPTKRRTPLNFSPPNKNNEPVNKTTTTTTTKTAGPPNQTTTIAPPSIILDKNRNKPKETTTIKDSDQMDTDENQNKLSTKESTSPTKESKKIEDEVDVDEFLESLNYS